MAVDGDTGTAWVEGVEEGLGQGEWIEFHFNDRERVRLICIANGYALTWDLYQRNARIRSFELFSDGDYVLAAGSLTDAATEERFAHFEEALTTRDLPPTDLLRLKITSVYAGSGRDRESDTSLSEIEFWVE